MAETFCGASDDLYERRGELFKWPSHSYMFGLADMCEESGKV